jgi:peptidoglycan biosynthesis protein MviN/MurJ (putative lipid II flippase)
MREIFQDKNGDLSAKRIFGSMAVVTAMVCIIGKIGEPELVKALLYSGFIALGVTAFEKGNGV